MQFSTGMKSFLGAALKEASTSNIWQTIIKHVREKDTESDRLQDIGCHGMHQQLLHAYASFNRLLVHTPCLAVKEDTCDTAKVSCVVDLTASNLTLFEHVNLSNNHRDS